MPHLAELNSWVTTPWLACTNSQAPLSTRRQADPAPSPQLSCGVSLSRAIGKPALRSDKCPL